MRYQAGLGVPWYCLSYQRSTSFAKNRLNRPSSTSFSLGFFTVGDSGATLRFSSSPRLPALLLSLTGLLVLTHLSFVVVVFLSILFSVVLTSLLSLPFREVGFSSGVGPRPNEETLSLAVFLSLSPARPEGPRARTPPRFALRRLSAAEAVRE